MMNTSIYQLGFAFHFFLLWVISSLAQNPKGFSANTDSQNSDGETFALIIGISRYQNSEIPSLQFADKDAFAFYEFLKAGGVDTNNILLRINEQARFGDFWSDMEYLIDNARRGDKVFIYFSGHGDVERKTIIRQAYLLPYDAPSSVYVKCAISIPTLKDYLATLSYNGVQVIFIADACHSGNLAGGKEGMAITADILRDKWQDEIKVLSCQPGELSLESKQWGNGRGLFSYELINGLAGKADRNADSKVTLHELDLYLSEKVPEGAEPNKQYPMVEGTNKEAVLSRINPEVAKLAVSQSSAMLAKIELKGSEKLLLENAGDSIKEYYKHFQTCLDTGNLIRVEYEGILTLDSLKSETYLTELPSAIYYFHKIQNGDSLMAILPFLKRNLSAALMNRISNLMHEIEKKPFSIKDIGNRQIDMLRENQVNAVALVKLLGFEKLLKLGFYSKALYCQAKAAQYQGFRVIPGAIGTLNEIISHDPYFLPAYDLKTTFIAGLQNSGYSKYDTLVATYNNLIELFPLDESNYRRRFLQDMSQILKDDTINVIRFFKYGRELVESSNTNLLNNYLTYITSLHLLSLKWGLGSRLGRPVVQIYVDTAFYFFKELLHDTSIIYSNKSDLLKYGHRLISIYTTYYDSCDIAAELFYRIHSNDSNFMDAHRIAECFAKNGNVSRAIEYMEVWLERGFKYFNNDNILNARLDSTNELKWNLSFFKSMKEGLLEPDEFDDYTNIRSTPEFIALMKKYFPEQYKSK